MIPLRDENPSTTIPIVNYVLIGLNILVFAFEWLMGSQMQQIEFVYQFALIPADFTDVNGVGLGEISDIFTSMFMHAGLAHIGGNMLYLWIFGDNIEDSMGSGRYLVFYLFGGVVASVAHILTNPNSVIPTVGASGAIGAVLGAYLVLFPRHRVQTLLFFGFFIRFIRVPAVILLGFWFILQLFNGVASLGGPDIGGTAFWAHIGGFLAGVVLAKLIAKPKPPEIYTYQRWD